MPRWFAAFVAGSLLLSPLIVGLVTWNRERAILTFLGVLISNSVVIFLLLIIFNLPTVQFSLQQLMIALLSLCTCMTLVLNKDPICYALGILGFWLLGVSIVIWVLKLSAKPIPKAEEDE